jgi:PAS domain S-box-containing protein
MKENNVKQNELAEKGKWSMPGLLKRYETSNFGVQQKVRFIYHLILSLFVGLVFLILSTVYIQVNSPEQGGLNPLLLLTQALFFTISIVSLWLLVRGYHHISSHLLFISSLICVWVVIFVDKGEAIVRMDSLAILIALLSIAPLIVSHKRVAILIYSIVNLCILFVYVYFIHHELKLSNVAVIDILVDLSVAILFVGVIGYSIFTINKRSIDRAVTDALEREKAEHALSKSESRYKELTDLLPQTVFEADLRGNLIYINENGYLAFRYSTEDFLAGVNIMSTLIPEDREKASANMAKVIAGEVTMGNEYTALRKDGTTFPIRIYSSLSVENGVPVGVRGIIIDITDQKSAEEEIRQRKEQFEALVSNVPGITYRCLNDEAWTMLFISSEVEHLTGYPVSDFVYNKVRSFKSLVFEEDRPIVSELIDATAIESSNWELEYRINHSDGSLRWVYEKGKAIFNDAGQIEYLDGLILDITDRKQAEKGLVESEVRYRNLFEQAQIGIYQTTPEGEILQANPALIKMLGYNSLEDLQSRHLENENVYVDSDREAFKNLIESIGVMTGHESKWKTKDGQVIVILENSRCVRDAEGKILYYEGFVENITERKKIEKELRDSELKYRTLMENLNEVIMMVDNDDKVLFVNEKFTEKLGYSSAEIIGKIGYEVLIASENQRVIIEANAQRTENIASQYELTFIAKDGRKIDFLVSGAPLQNDDGIVIGSIGAMMDITERNQAEKAFHESQQLFQTLAKMAPVGIFRTDAEGSTTYVNPKWCEFSGLSPEEAIGDGWLNAVHPDDRIGIDDGWKLKTNNKENSIAEYRFLKSDGSVVWVLGDALPEIVDGKVLGYIGTITNITELKNAHDEIARREKKFRDMADLLPQSIWETDINGLITYANNIGFEMFGYEHSDIDKGINILEMIIPEDRERARASFRSRINGEPSRGGEYTGCKKDGSTFPVKIYTSAIFDNGKPKGFRGVSIDITETKKAEKELKQSEERYRTIIESFPDIILVSDLNGNIVFANEPLSRITGITEADYNNPNRLAKIHPDDQLMVKEQITDLLSSNKRYTGIIENRFFDSEGNLHWFSGIISKVIWNDQVMLQTITRDVTERKKIEKELEKHRTQLEMLVNERTEELAATNEELMVTNEELLRQRQELESTLSELKTTEKQLCKPRKWHPWVCWLQG